MKKKLMLIVMLAAALFFVKPMTSDAADTVQGTWQGGTGSWWFQLEDGTYYANGFYTIDDVKYYFDAAGWMKTGWVEVDEDWYYFKSSGAMATGWVYSGGNYYYMEDDVESAQYGAMLTDHLLKTADGSMFYLNRNGVMATDDIIDWYEAGKNFVYAFDRNGYQIKNDWYLDVDYNVKQWMYFDGAGNPAQGWLQDGGSWYYLNQGYALVGAHIIEYAGQDHLYVFDTNGVLISDKVATNGWISVGENWYYYEKTDLVYGWKEISGKWYYFYPEMITSALIEDWKSEGDEPYYVIGADGTMARNQWVEVYGDWVYANEHGIALENDWEQFGSTWYYFEGPYMVDRPTMIDGKLELFHANGQWLGTSTVATGWVATGDTWYYLENAQFVTGWKKVGSAWYYFREYDYKAVCDTTYHFSNASGTEIYFFDTNAAMATGGWYQTSYGEWYWTNADGTVLSNDWKKMGSTWYYFGNNGRMYADGVYSIESGEDTYESHIFAESGAWLGSADGYGDGWQYLYGDWYYFEDGYTYYGFLKSGGQIYFMYEKMVTNDYRWLYVNPNWFEEGTELYGVEYIAWFGANGCMVTNQWVYIEDFNEWVWFDGQGYGKVPASAYY